MAEESAGIIIWVEWNREYLEGSHEDQLTRHDLIATIWLADTAEGVWGDDWNDSPAFCNAGTPYENTCLNLRRVELRLGEPLPVAILGVRP